jgi:hypothetical protein
MGVAGALAGGAAAKEVSARNPTPDIQSDVKQPGYSVLVGEKGLQVPEWLTRMYTAKMNRDHRRNRYFDGFDPGLAVNRSMQLWAKVLIQEQRNKESDTWLEKMREQAMGLLK